MNSSRLLSYGVAAAIALFGACQCKNPDVQERLKPEGVACAGDAECETGLCESLPGEERKCTRKCTSGCLENEICQPLGQDRYACVPDKGALCGECESDADCPYPADRCIQVGGVNVCGRDCSFDGTCPGSFQCSDGVGVDGSLAPTQCQPKSGTCECTAASDGQTIPCEATNSVGTCTGVKTCSAEVGYSACSARIPSAESCNGIDDDCNGQTDENLGETTCGVGECQVTVANCANGQAQTCTPAAPGTEVCDEKDNDCDEVVDNGFDKQNDVSNCGACGNVCSLPNATEQCTSGACAILMCDAGWWDADMNPANGCEYMCVVSNGGVEACDGVDNNCNGVADEGFDLNTDPQNCGACGTVCTFPNANPGCSAGQCVIASCVAGWDNCNQLPSDGCEINIYSDVNHCGMCGSLCEPANAQAACTTGVCGGTCNTGFADCDMQWPNGCEINTTNDVNNCNGCGLQCAFANASAACVNSACVLTQCAQDWWDLDGSAANGCEYNCVFQSATDIPDLGFVDANCDGIDGEVANAIFVATPAAGGNDLNPGTRAQPKATIAGGMAAAVADGKRDVYLAAGTYVEQAAITSPNKGLFGGYAAGTWSRSNSNGVTVTGVNSPLFIDNADGAYVQLITFLGANATGASATAYGAFIRNSQSVTLSGLTIKAGDGTNGTSGSDGATGTNGGNGSIGQPGIENDGPWYLICDSNARPLAGGGGTSSCARNGGSGGTPGHKTSAGSSGGLGAGGTPGGQGVPAGLGNWTPGAPYVGHNGASGSAGASGMNGAAVGTATFSGYVPAATSHGALGGHGNGGGGGGGGGGGDNNCYSYGGGGGGGGAGGCGGGGGKKGLSGGASIAIYLYDSTVTATDVSITAGNGGSGGDGGSGGTGGAGGLGGPTSQYSGEGEQDDASNGAAGGRGGAGGKGGAGGAGGGGPSIGVWRASATSWNPTGNTTVTTGSGGAGGSSPGGSGAAGLVQQVFP